MVGIDAEFTPEGKSFLKKYRKDNPQFKHARIQDVLQLFPIKIPLHKQYDLTF